MNICQPIKWRTFQLTPMAFKFPAYITNDDSTSMGFSQSRADKVMEKPDGDDEIVYGELKIRILTRQSAEWTDLVMVQTEPKQFGMFGGRIYHDWLDKPASDYSALQLFKWFVDGFGLPFSLGTFEGKLLRAETIPIAGASEITPIVKPNAPKQHAFAQSSFMRFSPDEDFVEAIVVFFIDLTAYRDAVGST